jgi:SAM-dependent methyltransferase
MNSMIRSVMPRRLVRAVKGILRGKIRSFPMFRTATVGKHGLEIGGPSEVFRSACPIYRDVAFLSNVVFSSDTLWERQNEGKTFNYHPHRSPGWNHILDGSDLHSIKSGSFDFVLSCHNLEHFANPVKALLEWKRVIRPGGHLILVLPDKRKTFDHRRPLTTVEHMLSDYENGVGEDDLTHIEEILQLHDLSRDPGAGTMDQFVQRCERNFEHRAIHHHTFGYTNSQELLEKLGFTVLVAETANPHHIFILAQ